MYRRILEQYPNTTVLYTDDDICDGAILSLLYTGELDEGFFHSTPMLSYAHLFEKARLHQLPALCALAGASLVDEASNDILDHGVNDCLHFVYQALDSTDEESLQVQRQIIDDLAVTILHHCCADEANDTLEELMKRYPMLAADMLFALYAELGEDAINSAANLVRILVFGKGMVDDGPRNEKH